MIFGKPWSPSSSIIILLASLATITCSSRLTLHRSQPLLNILSRRMLTLSLIDQPDNFSSRTLLNLAMSQTSFSFIKIAEEELRLAANDLDDWSRRVAGGIKGQRDEKDPEWVSLYEEFQRIMKNT